MLEDFSLLKAIAENSGRRSYITDERFNVLWSNADVSLEKVLRSAGRGSFSRPPEKETMISLSDGSALKITPIISEGAAKGYFFECYNSIQLIDALSKTSFFNTFTKQYSEFRDSAIKLIMYFHSAAETEREVILDKLDELLASTANKMSIFEILSLSGEPNVTDIYLLIVHCCSSLKALADNRNDLKILTEIDRDLYASVHKSVFEYAFINLLLNAYLYASKKNKIITINGRRENNSIIIEISDNGSEVSLERINQFKKPYSSRRNLSDKGGIGISIAQIFADKYGGELVFSKTQEGGLCACIKLPYKAPDNRLSLLSPNAEDKAELFDDILRKCFSTQEIRISKTR